MPHFPFLFGRGFVPGREYHCGKGPAPVEATQCDVLCVYVCMCVLVWVRAALTYTVGVPECMYMLCFRQRGDSLSALTAAGVGAERGF